MDANPILGILLYVLGGLAGAVFYLPFKKVKNWAWESYWMIYSLVAHFNRALGIGVHRLP